MRKGGRVGGKVLGLPFGVVDGGVEALHPPHPALVVLTRKIKLGLLLPPLTLTRPQPDRDRRQGGELEEGGAIIRGQQGDLRMTEGDTGNQGRFSEGGTGMQQQVPGCPGGEGRRAGRGEADCLVPGCPRGEDPYDQQTRRA